jgi:hypothetical protein
VVLKPAVTWADDIVGTRRVREFPVWYAVSPAALCVAVAGDVHGSVIVSVTWASPFMTWVS